MTVFSTTVAGQSVAELKSFSQPAIHEISTDRSEPPHDYHCKIQDERSCALQSWSRWFSAERSGWKPVTFKASMLGGFIFTSFSIITALEVLSWLSIRPQNGTGIAFAADVNSLSSTVVFFYLYFPTILAVCYSMMWSWVDLDVKRLEPWFQLSKPEGASASHSLLLEYPFDFLPFVPITALRRRHWGVFFAGIIMLMIFWIITPFQSAIFSTGTVTRSIVSSMVTTSKLLPITSHSTELSANFMDMAYGIAWLGQALPSFTTKDFAFLPYEPLHPPSSFLDTETWSTNVEAFHTNLTCTPAIVSFQGNGHTFSNGKGCVVPDIALMNTTGDTGFMVLYIGYFDDPHNDWSLQNPKCDREFANSFLALWASSTSYSDKGTYENLTSLFCETSYSSQQVYVSVNASNHRVSSYKAPETAIKQSGTNLSSIFNITNFEYLLGTGVPATALSQRFDFTDQVILQQDPHISNAGITWPNTNMVGFAVGLNTVPIDEWSQPAVLHQVFEKVHQLLFTAAFSTLTVTQDAFDSRTGMREDKPGAIIIVRSISIIVEGAFAIIIIFTVCLWYYSSHRRSALTSDPASISDIMTMMEFNEDICTDLHDDGTLSTMELSHTIEKKTYRLCQTRSGMRILPTSSVSIEAVQTKTWKSSNSSKSQLKGKSLAVRPFELSTVFGAVFVSVIFLSLAGLIFLAILSSKSDGIPLPSNSQVVRSIIENYAPTIFATLIEPVWMILNRILCLLLPLEELRKGNAISSSSIAAKYTSVPPQLAVWRALKARHFLLAGVCLVAVSTNVLAVALSALLNEGTTAVQIQFQTNRQFEASFNGTPIFSSDGSAGLHQYFDHFYVVMANVTQGASMPPWTDDSFFYIPFNINSIPEANTPQRTLQSFRGTTKGFGANVSCVELTPNGLEDQIIFDVNSNGTSIQLSTTHMLADGTQTKCVYPRGAHVFDPAFENTSDLSAFTNGMSSLEAVQHMDKSKNSTDAGFCSAALIMGWVRVGTGTSQAHLNATTSPNRPVTQTFLSCSQKLLTAQFEVDVDSSGRILESRRISDFDADISPYFSAQSTSDTVTLLNETVLFQQSTDLIASYGPNDFAWHNDSFTSDWMNSLLGMILHSNELVNPSSPVPNATFIAPVVEDLYAQLFAILLSLNTHVFSASATPMAANAVFIETRLFVSPLMFKLSVVILSLHLIVAILYYANRPKRFLPRMPTSIASILAFVAASRGINDFNGRSGTSDEKAGGEERRYGYGRFVGTDGRTKVGIEKQRYVVALEVENPHVKKRKWWNSVGRNGESEVKIWI